MAEVVFDITISCTNVYQGPDDKLHTNKQTNKGIRNFVTELSRNFRKFKVVNRSQK